MTPTTPKTDSASTDTALVRHLAAIGALKLLGLALLWWTFVQGHAADPDATPAGGTARSRTAAPTGAAR